jgi:predicted dehydrogenase
VEKPLTPDLPSTERLCSLARRTGTSVLVGHQHLRAPAFEELRRLVRDRAVKKIECLAGGDGPIRSDCDALWDYGPHDLSMVLDLLGRTAPVTVRRSGRRIPGPGSATWIADLEVGAAMVRLEISNALTAKKHRLSVTTADGDVFVYDDFARHRLRANGAAVDVSDELPLDRQVRQFVAQVRAAPGGGDPGELDLAVAIARTLRDIGNASVASAHV